MLRIIYRFTTNTALKKQKFLALIKPPAAVTIDVTPEQKQKINKEITAKMDELQRTGLSRQQILLSKSQKGIPLKVDPFFQFLKQNLKAREVYLRKNDRYTVQNVIDIALRQDIGADPSMSRVRGPDMIDNKGRADLLHELKDLRKGKFDPQSYDGPSSFSVQRAYDELKPHQPLRHYFKPVDRYEKRMQNLRQLKKYDIHWRNVELLRQFVTENGNIKSRYKNYLSDSDQRATRKAIKTARIMGAMPFLGRTPQPLKRNISSLEDEVQEIGYQHVNLETGHLFQTRSRSQDSIQVEIENQNDLDYKYKKMTEDDGRGYKLWVNNMEKVIDEEAIKSEKYARFLKNQQLEQKAKQEGAERQNLKKIITGISRFKSLREQDIKVPESDDQECKAKYEQEREEVLEQLNKDHEKLLERLLFDKLKV